MRLTSLCAPAAGIAAALLMANLQANLRSQSAVALSHPELFLSSVNRLFYENTVDSAYASLFFAQYDDATRRLRYAKLKGNACVEDIHYRASRGLERTLIRSLANDSGWVRRHDQLGGLAVLAVYTAIVGGAWLALSVQLPHGEARWPALLPGAALFGAGLLAVNVFNVYVTARLVENRANKYGALGIATALLFSLVLVGRVAVISAELNAALYRRRIPV